MTEPTTSDGTLAASRRALLGAAWTAPVVVAASTAPAYAASAAASLVLDTFAAYPAGWSGADPTRIETKVQVRREWSATSPVVRSLTVTIAFPTSVAAGGAAVSVSGSGWSADPVTGPANGAYTYSFTWNGTLDNTTQSTAELLFLVERKSRSTTSTTLTAYVTSPQATSMNRSITATI